MMRISFSSRGMLLLVFVAALPLTVAVFLYPTPQKAVQNMFGGRKGVEIVTTPTEVYATKVGLLPKEIFYEDADASNFPNESEGVLVPKASWKKVSTALLSPKSFAWEWATNCGFSPDRKFTFIRESEQIDVLVASDCSSLRVYRDDKFIGGEELHKSAQATIEEVFAQARLAE